MSAHRPWITALVGAVVLWASSVSGLGEASLAAANRVIPAAAGADMLPEPTASPPIRLADVLTSDAEYDLAGRAVDDGTGDALQTSGTMTGDGSALEHRLGVNTKRQATVERTFPLTFVLINIPQARLWMVRDGKVQGFMRVIVGRPDQPTPAMTTVLTHIILNPRWNVPQDLVRSSLAPEAARTRGRSLTEAGFEVLSGWHDDAIVVPADQIDWRAVATGRLEAPVRQKPWPGNAMGSAKFVITNEDGIYLHDTPDRAAFRNARRTLSAGCIRVEDYRRLVDFLVPQPLPPVGEAHRPTYVRLGAPMPIYLTYITAITTDEGAVLFPDPYKLDS